MRRTVPIPTNHRFVTVLVVLAVAAALPFAASAYADGDASDASNESDEIAPGEAFAGAVGVQDAEFEGDLEERTYGISVGMAASEDAQAEVVAERLGDVEQRLEDLEQRLEDAEEARQNGNISEGEYRAEVAQIAVERSTAERLAAQSETVAGALSDEILEAHGIDVEAIEELRTNASELGGEQVAELAQSIAGPEVGQSISGVEPGEPPIDVGELPDNHSDDAPGGPPDDGAPGDGTGDDDDSDDGDNGHEDDDGEDSDGDEADADDTEAGPP